MSAERSAQEPEPRRLKTRRRISRAAQHVFRERGIAGTSIEAIVRAAGVSRATFYLHFDGKEAIVREQMREQDGHLLRLYAMLRDVREPNVHAVRDWLQYHVTAARAFRGELYLFSLSTAFDDAARRIVADQRRRVIALLGERFAAFRPDAEDKRGRTRCLLMMFALEQCVAALVHGDVLPDEAAALDEMAGRLATFIEDGAASP